MEKASPSCSKKPVVYSKRRYIIFGLITLLALIAPFITSSSGNHIFLLSFDKKVVHILFNSFSTQELYLLPFMLISFFLFIFFITTLGGRVWCGWSCPQTIFRVFYRDFLETKVFGLRRSIANKQKEPKKGDLLKKIAARLIWLALAFLIASNFIWFFIPPEDYIVYIQNPAEHKLFIGIVVGVALFLFFDVTALRENFCIYICPYARVQSVMFDNDTVQVIYDEKRGGVIYDKNGVKIANKPTGEGDLCIGCNACVNVCPTHIDIRKGMQLECINCLECADACEKVMHKFNEKSLIEWTSQNAIDTSSKINFFRFRTIGYLVVIAVALSVLFYMGSKKENMLLNINRSSELYTIDRDRTNGDIVISNDYIFMIENTDNSPHEYYFEILNDGIEIARPTEAIKVSPKQKRRVIVILNAKNTLGDNSSADVMMPITIKAFAVDKKEIVVERKSVFVYPKQSSIDSTK